VFCVVFFTAMFVFPQALSFILLGRSVNATIYGFLLFFIPIVIMQTLTIAVLQGEMELPAAARTQYGVQTASFALAVGAYVAVHKGWLPDTGAAVLVVPVAYLLSFASGLLALVRVMRRRWQLSLRWYLPPNFWRFTTTFHFNTVVFFFFVNVNQIFILYTFAGSIKQIGIFRAAILVATYALWAPNLFTGAMYPFFTNLVARKDFATLKAAYQRYSAITGMIVALVSLTAGLFAPQILRLFGKAYVDQATPLMVIFALMYLAFASAAYVPSTALITAHEDIWLNLLLNILAFGVRFGLYFPFVFILHKGLIGIASADAISLGVLYLGTLLAVWLRYRVTVPLRQHLVSIVGVVLLVGTYAWQPTGQTFFASHTWQIVERFGALALFLVVVSQLRLVSREDLARVAHRLGPLAKVLRLTASQPTATNAPIAR
jgi:O-antigen/teichoic acid export membrane protein